MPFKVGFSDPNLPIDHHVDLPAHASTNLEHLLGPSPGVGNFLEASGNGLLPDEVLTHTVRLIYWVSLVLYLCLKVALKEDFVATPGMACLGTMEELRTHSWKADCKKTAWEKLQTEKKLTFLVKTFIFHLFHEQNDTTNRYNFQLVNCL